VRLVSSARQGASAKVVVSACRRDDAGMEFTVVMTSSVSVSLC
jgi:hypothetical protein